jgi:hypothetical protein
MLVLLIAKSLPLQQAENSLFLSSVSENKNLVQLDSCLYSVCKFPKNYLNQSTVIMSPFSKWFNTSCVISVYSGKEEKVTLKM